MLSIGSLQRLLETYGSAAANVRNGWNADIRRGLAWRAYIKGQGTRRIRLTLETRSATLDGGSLNRPHVHAELSSGKMTMRCDVLAIAAAVAALFGSPGAKARNFESVRLVTMDIKDCGPNAAQSSSVRITTNFRVGLSPVRFAFKNILTGQVHNFIHSQTQTSHDFDLPGGRYTLRISDVDTASNVLPRSVELVYDSPITVPVFINGQCVEDAAISKPRAN